MKTFLKEQNKMEEVIMRMDRLGFGRISRSSVGLGNRRVCWQIERRLAASRVGVAWPPHGSLRCGV